MKELELLLDSCRSDFTKTQYAFRIQKYFDFLRGKLPKGKEKIEQKILEYITYMKKEGASYYTISISIAAIKSFYVINDVMINTKKIGNVLTPNQVDNCIQLGSDLKDIPISQYTLKIVGVDVGFSSSNTAIVMTEHLKDEDKIIVRYSEEIDKGDPNAIADQLFDYHRKYQNIYFLIDGSNRAMVNLLKIKFDEPLDWDPSDVTPESMKVLPINFMTDHKQMLSHLHMVISKGYLAIPKEHEKLITSLRTAHAQEYSLNKEETSYDDLLDALRLSLKGYNIE